MDPGANATQLLSAAQAGDQGAAGQLMEIVYDDLRELAHKYVGCASPTPTLAPTAVVHEAFLRLVKQDSVGWRDRSHFFAVGARAMRQILTDHARRKAAVKRGGGGRRVALGDELTISTHDDEDVLAVDAAIERLARINVQRARIVELRFFGGMSIEEIAEALSVSRRTVQKQWAATHAWLHRELTTQAE